MCFLLEDRKAETYIRDSRHKYKYFESLLDVTVYSINREEMLILYMVFSIFTLS